MSGTVQGLPETSNVATYGGPLANSAAVVDPTTDIDKTKLSVLFKDAAGMSKTACRAWYTFLGNATTPTEPTSNVHGAVWGDDPVYKPTTAVRVSPGVYRIDWPTTVNDELGVAHTVNFRRALRPNIESSTLYHSQAVVTAANEITVYVWNAAGALTDPVGVPITVSAV